MKNLLPFLCCMLLVTSTGIAQSVGPAVLNTTGGHGTIGDNVFYYAIGDVVSHSTHISDNLVVTHGVLQPQVSDPNDIPVPVISSSDLLVFPNPADYILFLQPHFGGKGVLKFSLSDALGRMLITKEVSLEYGNEQQEIKMAPFAAGQYTLNVQWKQQGKISSNAYKIQKIN